VIDQLKLDMKAPVVKQPLLDPNFTSVMPFFAKNQFVAPFAQASKAPFASNKNFSFLHVEDTPQKLVNAKNSDRPAKLVYASNTDHLYVTVKRQAHVLYAPGLERHVLRSSDGTADFGLRFLQKVYIVGATFEAMQSWCHQQAHLRWEMLHIEEEKESDKPGKERATKTVSGVAVPVLNPHHRNVLDHNDQAEDYISVEEL
jgi:hypothetical protein